LTQTQTPTSSDVSLCDTSLASLLRRSLFQILTESLPRLSSPEASRSLRQAQDTLRAGALRIALRASSRSGSSLLQHLLRADAQIIVDRVSQFDIP
jgi:hypothetical protein